MIWQCGGQVIVNNNNTNNYNNNKEATSTNKTNPETQLCILRERNVLFNDALNTFYLRLYGVRHMVKDHSDS